MNWSGVYYLLYWGRGGRDRFGTLEEAAKAAAECPDLHPTIMKVEFAGARVVKRPVILDSEKGRVEHDQPVLEMIKKFKETQN